MIFACAPLQITFEVKHRDRAELRECPTEHSLNADTACVLLSSQQHCNQLHGIHRKLT